MADNNIDIIVLTARIQSAYQASLGTELPASKSPDITNEIKTFVASVERKVDAAVQIHKKHHDAVKSKEESEEDS